MARVRNVLVTLRVTIHHAERDEYNSAIVALTCLLSIVAGSSLGAAEDWPHWRGPNRTGVVAEASGWNGNQWLNREPAWTGDVGEGASSPLAVAVRAFTLGHREDWNRLRALDWETGEQLWEGPPVGDAGSCIVTADDKQIVWAKQGELILADAAPSLVEYRELARIERLADSDVWPHVALSDRRLFCRDRAGMLMCFATPSVAKPK